MYTIANLGFDEYFEMELKKTGFDKSVARVIAEYREAYLVKNFNGEFLARVTGKQLFTSVIREDYPAVGDWVTITELPDTKAVILGILPRKSILRRKASNKQDSQIIGTNIDTAFIVESMDRDYNLNRFERFLVLTEESNIHPTLILNKIDLISENELFIRINQIRKRFNTLDILSISNVTRQGLSDLKHYIISGKTYCFLGSSGVGKSSLINSLLEKVEIVTREISITLERGKHTTTTREMYFLENGGILIDNPGTREVGIVGSDFGIDAVFDEINHLSLQCKFKDCSHTNEPGCVVRKAINENILDEEKYNNFVKLRKESEFYKMTSLEKRQKDRKFGKYVKKVLKELER